MDVLRERQESIPRVSSSIVTPTLSAVGAKKNSKPPSLPIFSGEQPTPRGEAEYQQWVFQVNDSGFEGKCAGFRCKVRMHFWDNK